MTSPASSPQSDTSRSGRTRALRVPAIPILRHDRILGCPQRPHPVGHQLDGSESVVVLSLNDQRLLHRERQNGVAARKHDGDSGHRVAHQGDVERNGRDLRTAAARIDQMPVVYAPDARRPVGMEAGAVDLQGDSRSARLLDREAGHLKFAAGASFHADAGAHRNAQPRRGSPILLRIPAGVGREGELQGQIRHEQRVHRRDPVALAHAPVRRRCPVLEGGFHGIEPERCDAVRHLARVGARYVSGRAGVQRNLEASHRFDLDGDVRPPGDLDVPRPDHQRGIARARHHPEGSREPRPRAPRPLRRRDPRGDHGNAGHHQRPRPEAHPAAAAPVERSGQHRRGGREAPRNPRFGTACQRGRYAGRDRTGEFERAAHHAAGQTGRLLHGCGDPGFVEPAAPEPEQRSDQGSDRGDREPVQDQRRRASLTPPRRTPQPPGEHQGDGHGNGRPQHPRHPEAGSDVTAHGLERAADARAGRRAHEAPRAMA